MLTVSIYLLAFLALEASGLPLLERTSRMVQNLDCKALNGTQPIKICNSPYTRLPNGSLCCPTFPFDPITNEPICINESRVEEHCKQLGRSVVKEPCRYCKICGKLRGETCRGPQNLHGHCSKGLECIGVGKYDTEVGVCRDIGGPVTKPVGEVCGGRNDSLGVCEDGAKCTKIEDEVSVCVQQSKTKGFDM